MKLSNLIAFAGAAAISYRLVKNRHTIKREVSETADAFQKAQDSLDNIRYNMGIIEEQGRKLTEMAQDVSYQYKVLEKQAGAQIEQIQRIWKKSES